VAGHRFWRRQLGGDTGALGRELRVGGVTCTVTGVAPPRFSGLEVQPVDLWLPLRPGIHDLFGDDPGLWTTDRRHWVRVAARLAPRVTVEAAEAEATLAYRSFSPRQRDPELIDTASWRPIVAGEFVRSSTVDITTLLLAGGGVLLLLILANLTNLFLARDLGRTRETAVRLALGSSRLGIFGHRVLESGALALAAGAIAVAAAMWLGPVLRRILVSGTEFATPAVSLLVVGAALASALGAGVVIAGVSTWRLGRMDPAVALRAGGSARSGDARGTRAFRLGLVSTQAALSAALLLASLAFIQSFRNAAKVDLGFELDGLIAAQVPLDDLGYDQTRQRAFYRQAWERVRTVPGVAGASLGYMTPWWNNRNEPISIPGRDTVPLVPRFGSPAFDAVTPDYLNTMGLRLIDGRWLTDADGRGAAPVVVINEALAGLYWPDVRAVGECMWIGDDPGTPCREVVGVVANHRFTGSLEVPPVAAYFLPLDQAESYGFVPRLFVRASGDPSTVIAPLGRWIQTLAPSLPAARLTLLEDRYEPLVASWRLGSAAFTGLGLLATLVGTLGLFSLLSFVVAERRREFAIRSAVGASAEQIARPVLRQGVATVMLGVGIGSLLALAAAPWLHPLLFDTRLGSPLSLGITGALLIAIAALASLAPAREAAAQNPMDVLRAE
jgi:predicted permease